MSRESKSDDAVLPPRWRSHKGLFAGPPAAVCFGNIYKSIAANLNLLYLRQIVLIKSMFKACCGPEQSADFSRGCLTVLIPVRKK